MTNKNITISDNIIESLNESLSESISDKNKGNFDEKLDENIVEKPKKIRIFNRAKKYETERKEIVNKIFDILNLNENNKTFFTHMIDENKINKILELQEEIRKCFNTSNWTSSKQDIKNRHISLIKSVFKDMSIKFDSKSYKKRDYTNGVNYSTTEYTILI